MRKEKLLREIAALVYNLLNFIFYLSSEGADFNLGIITKK
ncbi:Transposase [Candidatus Ornithobacterium hominis]|nr:Transposase [Candidatus Ornithobacterium hominis]SZD72570.1 Uncharacterised protein [Candidatus Ornithobacterium hominis]